MYKEKYDKIYDYFTKKPHRLKILQFLSKASAIIGYVAYIVLIAYLLLTENEKIYKCIYVPALTFLFATVVRKVLNFPRPYEKYDITPLVKKDTKGKSFPSRHVVCLAIISASWIYVYLPAGIFMCILTAVVMVIRPLSGVHFPRDTAAGALFSIVCAFLGFCVF